MYGQMKLFKVVSMKRWLVLLAAVAFGAFAAMPAFAQGDWGDDGESGDVCIQSYQPGFTCTAGDVPDFEFQVVEIVEGCSEGTIGEMEVVVNAVVGSGPDRYDLGMFVASNGGSALSGDSCYHGYLGGGVTETPSYGDTLNPNGIPEVVNGPWWNGETQDAADTCGDIESNTEVIVTLPTMRLACVDNDGDGAADVDVCLSWDNNRQDTCSDVSGAIPGTNSKCGCTAVDFPFQPTAITSLQAQSTGADTLAVPFAGITAALAIVTLLIITQRRRNALTQ